MSNVSNLNDMFTYKDEFKEMIEISKDFKISSSLTVKDLMEFRVNFWIKLENGSKYYFNERVTDMKGELLCVNSFWALSGAKDGIGCDSIRTHRPLFCLGNRNWFCFNEFSLTIVEIRIDVNNSCDYDDSEVLWRKKQKRNFSLFDTSPEYLFLKKFNLKHQDFYLTRNDKDELWLNLRKPVKDSIKDEKVTKAISGKPFYQLDSEMFQFITKNDEPYSVQELLSSVTIAQDTKPNKDGIIDSVKFAQILKDFKDLKEMSNGDE